MFDELIKALNAIPATPAMDYGTHEGAVKAAETRKTHGYGTTEIVQKGNSHILVSPQGYPMGEYGDHRTALNAGAKLGYFPGTLTQNGTTVMMRRDGVATREMPHWNNHDQSVRQMNRLRKIGYLK